MSRNHEANHTEVNPVAQVIATRTLQVGAVSVAALLLLRRTLPPEQTRHVLRLSRPLVTAGLSAYFLATFSPATRFPGDRFYRRLIGADDRDAVALTFDDGPHPATTPRLLDALAAGQSNGTTASGTFFVVAERAQKYPALVRRIVEEGHTLGVHGLSHRTMALDNAARIERELSEAERRIEDALGVRLRHRLFRPPYGFKTLTLARTTAHLSWTTVGWSCDPRDYDGISAARILAHVSGRLRPRDVVLLHERPGSVTTIEAIPAIVRLCDRRGLNCVALGRAQNS